LYLSKQTNHSIVSRSGEDIFNSERDLKKSVVYPNPMQKQFNIKFPATYKGEFILRIADQIGRIYNLGKIRIQPGDQISILIFLDFRYIPGFTS
jgi:hypothetical protein